MRNKLKNLLVFGCTGLLGKCLIDYFQNKKKFKIHAAVNKTKINNKNIKFVNSKNSKLIEKFIKKNNIDTIINFAGLTNIELCQKNIKLSEKSNYKLPIHLAELSKRHKLNYVFISTDNFKFKSNKLNENSKILSLNNYSQHKKKAENSILNNYPKSLIIRTNFYCIGDSKRSSFFDTIFNSINLKKEIGLFNDVFYTPIYGKYLLKYIFKLLEKNKNGIYNISSNEKITKYHFGIEICNVFKLNKKYIKVNYLKNRKDLVRRPLNMALNNSKLKKNISINIPSIKYQLQVMKKDFRL